MSDEIPIVSQKVIEAYADYKMAPMSTCLARECLRLQRRIADLESKNIALMTEVDNLTRQHETQHDLPLPGWVTGETP